MKLQKLHIGSKKIKENYGLKNIDLVNKADTINI